MPHSCAVRTPESAAAMTKAIEAAKADNDSVGGVVTCVIRNVPLGLGEPTFDKLEAMLGHAMLSIPATKAFEIGSGFAGTRLRGSKHNDMFSKEQKAEGLVFVIIIISRQGILQRPVHLLCPRHHPRPVPGGPLRFSSARLRTVTNNSGGIQGGISNGEDIVFRVAFKPPGHYWTQPRDC